MCEVNSEYYTLVVELPKDQEQRGMLLTILRLGNTFHGGRIVDASAGDLIEKLERCKDGHKSPDGSF